MKTPKLRQNRSRFHPWIYWHLTFTWLTVTGRGKQLTSPTVRFRSWSRLASVGLSSKLSTWNTWVARISTLVSGEITFKVSNKQLLHITAPPLITLLGESTEPVTWQTFCLSTWRPPWGPMSFAPMAASSMIDRNVVSRHKLSPIGSFCELTFPWNDPIYWCWSRPLTDDKETKTAVLLSPV